MLRRISRVNAWIIAQSKFSVSAMKTQFSFIIRWKIPKLSILGKKILFSRFPISTETKFWQPAESSDNECQNLDSSMPNEYVFLILNKLREI